MTIEASTGEQPGTRANVTVDLGGDAWRLTDVVAGHQLPATVPGSVHLDLLRAGAIADPFYRENEAAVAWIGERDWTYGRRFDVARDMLARRHHILRFYGLDTLAVVRLNGRDILTATNMHRTWEVDVTGLLKEHDNQLEVTFASPKTAISARQADRPLPGWYQMMCIEGAGWLRKQLSNFGWDWGPALVTAGIWRPVELTGFDDLLLTHVDIDQQHASHRATVRVRLETSVPLRDTNIVTVELRDPRGTLVDSASGTGNAFELNVARPQLWWPRGLGDQPLYRVAVVIHGADGIVVTAASRRIGLRTLRLVRDRDSDGETFGFECNGVPFFAKGANWIPADAVVGRAGPDMVRRLVADAAAAHMNMLRVWGGGVYEEDTFYDACDELGICVWQDAAFACVTFPGFDREYVTNVRVEFEQNVRRLRHHPSLGLWCGNNELELGLVGDGWSPRQMSWEDYTPLMDDVLSDVVRRLDPGRDYWPASPHTPGPGRSDANSPSAGDAHLWQVWHGGQPPSWYRTSAHRFVSEFGFQSFPHPATIDAVTEPEDRNISSPVMDAHQKARAAGAGGSAELARQLVQYFRAPGSWDGLVWQTQFLQALAVTTGVEHWRRSLARTRGVLYWQLNDCWPGPSWSSIDGSGRWKALHYAMRRAYAPVMLSLVEDARAGTVEAHVTNDTLGTVPVTVDWTIAHTSGELLASGSAVSAVQAGCDQLVVAVDATEQISVHGARNVLVFASIPQIAMQRAVATFVPSKHLSLRDPRLSMTRERNGVTVRAARPALWVWLDAGDRPLSASDNFFPMLPGEYSVSLLADDDAQLTLRSLVDTVALSPR